jgi:hypothetical protein
LAPDREYALDITDLAQFGLYLVAVNAWWWVVIRDVQGDVQVAWWITALIAVLIWVLLAVFDDYLRISQYAHRTGETLWWPNARIFVTNIFICVAVAITIVRPLHLLGTTLNIYVSRSLWLALHKLVRGQLV